MLFILLILQSFAFSDTLDNSASSLFKAQVSDYITNLGALDISINYNAWALQEVAVSNCQTFNFVKDQLLKNTSRSTDVLEGINCTNRNLDPADKEKFFKYFQEEYWNESISDLYQDIISNKTELNTEIVGYDAHFLHVNLLMRSDFKTYYTTEYLESALDNWVGKARNDSFESEIMRDILISNIIWGSYILDRYDIIREFYRNFLDSKLLPNSLHKFRVLGALEYTFYTLGYYDRSLQILNQSTLPIAYFINDPKKINETLQRKGVFLFSLGKYQDSKKIYEELFDNTDESFRNSVLFNNLGISYLKLGQANKYLTFQLQALDKAISNGNYTHLLNIYRNLIIYYIDTKDLSNALFYFNEAKEVAIENSDSTELALIDSYMATFYWSSYKDYENALSYLNSAEESLSPDNNYTLYANLVIEKGTILNEIDSLDSSKEIFNRLKEFALSKSDTPRYIEALVNLTEIHLKRGELDQAASNLEEIKLYSLDDIDFQLLTKYYTVRSNFLSVSGDSRSAITELEPVLGQVIDRAKNNTDSQQGYWSVEDEYLDAFELLVGLYIDNDQPEKALLLLDQLKTINDAALYNSPLVKAAKLSEGELAEEKRLNEKLQSLRKRYLNATEDERFTIKTEIDRTSALREQILAEVNLNKETALPPVWSIQRSIQPEELIVHFTEIGTKLYVSYLTQNDIDIRIFDFSNEVQETFNQTADELASGRTNLNHLYDIYELLGLEDLPTDYSNVSVIPDNSLYRIPLEVLPTKKPSSAFSFGSSHYLIEDFSFRYFTSLKEFENNRRSFTTSVQHDFSGFAISDFSGFEGSNLPSLPFATVENTNINLALTSLQNKRMYNGDEATKEIFKSQVGSSRLVHVATHSEVSEQDPLFSTIYLKNSNPLDTLESDQALYAYELFDTPLNSEFIMLNSCSSGSGSYIQGSGVMGISRALRYAGAKSLALNLWSVNDKVASEFATDFYSYLNEGITKSEAIRKAKLNQLKKANANPHFWGAYMLIGNPSPITDDPSENGFLLFSLLTFTAIFAGFSTYYKAT
ncbi:MAG: CHAT domain-containing protein [Gracilimonas sp.]